MINIKFTIVIIDNNQTNSSLLLFTAGAEYLNASEIYVSQAELVYSKNSVAEDLSTAAFGVISSPTTKISAIDSFNAELLVQNARYFNLNLTLSTISSAISICSLHIKVISNKIISNSIKI